jgi:Ca2+-binding EF-hand superfamily protein
VSQQIVHEKLRQNLTAIFEALDADSNGYITAQEINIDYVSIDILNTLSPLLIEMEAGCFSLDLSEFIESYLVLQSTLTVTQKN